MADMIKITGMQQVIRNINAARNKISTGIDRGLIRGGQFLQAESMKICPVNTGNLRASAFTRKAYIGRHHVIVGYTAFYAGFVHENLNAAHGKAFNIKYADRIARRGLREKRARKLGMSHTVTSDPYHMRGEKQQAKFLERPAREKRTEILKIVADEAKRI